MKKNLCKRSFELLLCFSCLGVTIAAETNMNSPEIILKLANDIQKQLVSFETNKSVDAIDGLKDMVNTLNDLQSGNLNPPTSRDREFQARLWFSVLAKIDSNLTETKKQYSWSLVPPRDGTNGIQYPAGVTPDTLKDPIARSNYMEAIRTNNEGIAKANVQLALHKLNDGASAYSEKFLLSAYNLSGQDTNEIASLVHGYEISGMRKQKILKLFKLLPSDQ